MTGSDAVGLTMGYYDTSALPDLQVPAHPPPPGLRDRRRLLPGGLRRLVPQPPVAGRGGDADVAERGSVNDGAARRPALGGRRQRDADHHNYPLYNSPPAPTVKDGALTASCQPPGPAAADAGRRDLRRLRRQHDPADLPALPARHRRRAQAPAADGADDRRPPQREGRRLGLVLGRLVERRRRRRRARLDERHRAAPATCTNPKPCPDPAAFATRLAQLPGQALPVPPPAAELLRLLRARHGRRAPRTCATRPSSRRWPRARRSTARSSR